MSDELLTELVYARYVAACCFVDVIYSLMQRLSRDYLRNSYGK